MDKELLFKSRVTERDVDIPGVGTVRVRSLTRAESTSIVGKEMPLDELERKLLVLALVDPQLTADEIDRWYAAAPTGELEPVLEAIRDLSGVKAGAAKDAYRQFRS